MGIALSTCLLRVAMCPLGSQQLSLSTQKTRKMRHRCQATRCSGAASVRWSMDPGTLASRGRAQLRVADMCLDTWGDVQFQGWAV